MFTEYFCPLDPNWPIQCKQFKKHSDPYGHLKIFFLWYRLEQQEMTDIPREN